MSAPHKVMVAGTGISAFGIWPDRSMEDFTLPTVDAAINDAGLSSRDVQAIFVGNAFGGLIQGQEAILGQMLLARSGLSEVPIHNVKNACSSGSDAVHLAWSAVAYGQYDCVLAIGTEKMSHDDRSRAMSALATVGDRQPSDDRRSIFMDLNAERANRYMSEFGASPRHFAMCAAKNRAHAALNENAAVRIPISVEDILADRVVVPPLTRSMCGGICDGAASIILVSEAFARRKGLEGPHILASIIVSGSSTPDAGSATKRAGVAAFEHAGISPGEVSLAEVHDPTSPQELRDLEELGFCPEGGAIALLEDGATSLGGRFPVNVSGGLTSRGHPAGATGVAQIAEISDQLRGRGGRAQVDNARIGVAQMAGGLVGSDSAVATVHILSRQEN